MAFRLPGKRKISSGDPQRDSDASATGKRNTASPQVHLLSADFRMPQLRRRRGIWIYLPVDYHASARRYPVIYMHDGQNLFNEAIAFAGEWQVDETIDAAPRKAIVVAIENAGHRRMTEYNCLDHHSFGKAEGNAYLAFIVRTLKPFVDRNFRTLSDRRNTAVAGSSMGGLISIYAAVDYPEVFGAAGIFSPSFWIGHQLQQRMLEHPYTAFYKDQRYFFYGGGQEAPNLLPDMLVVAAITRKAGAETIVVTDPDGGHNEASWAKHFNGFFEWLTNAQGG